jgi:hypothetical protein
LSSVKYQAGVDFANDKTKAPTLIETISKSLPSPFSYQFVVERQFLTLDEIRRSPAARLAPLLAMGKSQARSKEDNDENPYINPPIRQAIDQVLCAADWNEQVKGHDQDGYEKNAQTPKAYGSPAFGQRE